MRRGWTHESCRTRGFFYQVVSAWTSHILRVSAHTLHILLYTVPSANASTCVSESTSRLPVASLRVLHFTSHHSTLCQRSLCLPASRPRLNIVHLRGDSVRLSPLNLNVLRTSLFSVLQARGWLWWRCSHQRYGLYWCMPSLGSQQH